MKINVKRHKILLLLAVISLSALNSCSVLKKSKNIAAPENDKNLFEVIQIQTSFGDIFMWLYDATPEHKKNFIKLTQDGYFNGTTFHRVIKDFVIQGGDPLTKDLDPTNDGEGGPDYTLPAEINPDLLHEYGAVGAARESDAINPERRSSGSQFYIVQNQYGTKHLDGKYTVFGQVISGMDVVDKIASQPTGEKDRPVMNITMQEVKVVKYTAEELLEKFNFVVPVNN